MASSADPGCHTADPGCHTADPGCLTLTLATTLLTLAAGNALFTYTPNPNWFGDDTFTFGIASSTFPGQVFSNPVSIEVRPVNDVPVLQNQAGMPLVPVPA